MSKQLAVRRMSQWLRSLSGASSKLSDRGVEQPLLRELFSAEQLIEHAKSLAARHKLDPVPRPDRLLSRLTENEKVLAYAYELENRAAEKKRDLTATSDWLLDNYYVMEEQIRIARQHLPKGYSRQLPRLANSIPPSAPRVYMICLLYTSDAADE